MDRTKWKANGKNDNDNHTKVVVKKEPDSYVWSIFTLKGVRYFTSKVSLEEEANNFISENKDDFFVKTVHADRAASDSAHEMLRKKFEKMDKATLTEFMTNQVDIDKDKIEKIVSESNGNAFLNLNTDGKADAQQVQFYVFFCPKYLR